MRCPDGIRKLPKTESRLLKWSPTLELGAAWHVSTYSWRSASIGSKFAARRAGK
jgi:hypothetical protein